MPKALGRGRLINPKTLTVAVTVAATAGWVAGSAVDPPRAALALMGIGAAGVGYFSLRPRLRHSHSSLPLPLFPVLVVA